jgi:GTPase-associated system helical domain
MTHIATHIRIFASDPSDDLVTKRTEAIGLIANAMGAQRNLNELLRYANDFAVAVQQNGSLSASLTGMIEGAIRKSSTAFVAEGHELEMLVCGLSGALQALTGAAPIRNGATSIPDVLSFGLWSALSFQKPRGEAKLEQLRNELMQAAQQHCERAASEGRKRVEVPDPEFKKATKKKEDDPEPAFDADAVNQGLQPFRTALADLRANAAIDREEIDLLWWVLSDWSALLRRRFSTEKGTVAAVASGLEVGRMIRRTPAEAHHHLVLRNVMAGKDLSLQELLTAIGGDRAALAPTESQTYISHCPAVFPLSSALTTGSAHDALGKVKRPIGDWADRALLESAIAHICSNLPSVSV